MVEKTLNEILLRIVAAAQPEKVILFGSHARNEATENSDLDLLIVKSGAERRETAQKIYQCLVGIDASVDVVVATPEDLEKYKDSSALVDCSALKEGKVIYVAA